MTNIFRWAVKIALRHEGGLVTKEQAEAKGDPGGETKYGISKRAYPHLDISSLTREDAIKIYYKDYWPTWLDSIQEAGLALQLFDFGINAGPKRMVQTLQKSLRVTVDGLVGPKTLGAINNAHPQYVRNRFAEEVIIFYTGLMVKNSVYTKFFRGWLRRALDNLTQQHN